VEQHTARLPGGLEINYYTARNDTGAPIVLLHGGNLDSALLSWKPTINVLSEAGYRVFAPDFPGYGQSPAPKVPYTIDLLVQCVSDLLDFWKLEKATLVGLSMGGGAALGTTLAHPEKVQRLVLVGAYGLQDKAPFHTLSYFLVRMPLMNDLTRFLLRTYPSMIRTSLKTIVRDPNSLTDELVQEAFAALTQSQSSDVWAQFQRDELRWRTVKTCYMPRLHEITAPVLIINGTHDIAVPAQYAKEAAQRIPNAKLALIDNAGHWTQRDKPTEFHRLLLDFLAS